jgi:hypothetical protein
MIMDMEDTAEETVNLERLVKETRARMLTIIQQSGGVATMLAKIKGDFNAIVARGLRDVQSQSQLGFVRCLRAAWVYDVVEMTDLTTWIETLHWEPDTRKMRASWVVRAIHP